VCCPVKLRTGLVELELAVLDRLRGFVQQGSLFRSRISETAFPQGGKTRIGHFEATSGLKMRLLMSYFAPV
jgi:hypothetical protein